MVPLPPTRRSLGWPAPFAPWQPWHLVKKTCSPCATVPLPGGRPAPLGRISMSQGARSAGEIGWPNCAVCAEAAAAPASRSAVQSTRLRIRICRLPLRIDRPGLDRVEVVVAAQAPLGDELRARGLHHAEIVGG